MGNWIYPVNIQSPSKKLCDDIIDDYTDFTITIWVFAAVTPVDLRSTMEHLQHTHPLYSYTHNKNIILLYSPNQKATKLRSNVSGEVISSITYDVASYLLRNGICDPYDIEVSINVEKNDIALKKMLKYIANNNYRGFMYGIDNLSAEKINEQFT